MIVDIILWICVSHLCLMHVNESYSLKKEWETTPLWKKIIYFVILPLLFALMNAIRLGKGNR